MVHTVLESPTNGGVHRACAVSRFEKNHLARVSSRMGGRRKVVVTVLESPTHGGVHRACAISQFFHHS